MKNNRLLSALISSVFISLAIIPGPGFSQLNNTDLLVFYGQGCPHCSAMLVFLDSIKEKYPTLSVHAYEVYSHRENIEKFATIAAAYNTDIGGVPMAFIGDKAFAGYSAQIGADIENKIQDCVNNGCQTSLFLIEDIPEENLNNEASFNDVPSSHPNYDAINYVRQQGIVGGYPDGTYKPDGFINRAEFTKIVTLALFGQEMIDKCGTFYDFSDVPRDAWYVKYICRARDGWLLTGYPDGSFRPAQNINFSETAKIIANGYGLIHRTEHCNGKLCPDIDTADHPWYEQYVLALEEKNAIPVSISRFDQAITRGEMAEIIYRLKAGIKNKPARNYHDLM